MRALLGPRQVAVGHVANDPVGIDRLIADVRSLVDAGQEAAAPQLRADDRLAGAEHHEARAGSGSRCPGRRPATSPGWAGSAACCPSSSSRARARGWGCRCTSSGARRFHRCSPRRAGTGLVSSIPLWPCGRAAKRRGHDLAALSPAGRDRRGRVLPGVALERGLGIKRINVRRSAVHEQKDHPLGSRREVRRPGSQRIAWNRLLLSVGRGARRLCRRCDSRVREHLGQPQGTEPAANPRNNARRSRRVAEKQAGQDVKSIDLVASSNPIRDSKDHRFASPMIRSNS